MARYFAEAPPADAAWAVFFLTGRRLKRLVPVRRDPRLDAGRRRGLPSWLLEESLFGGRRRRRDRGARPRSAAGRRATASPLSLAQWVEDADPRAARHGPGRRSGARSPSGGAPLDRLQRFVLLKMITGELRVGVSQTLVVRALAQAAGASGRDPRRAAHGRLVADAEFFSRALGRVDRRGSLAAVSFLLAAPLDDRPRRSATRRLAARMEMGRLSRAADPARRPGVYLVAWRGPHHPAFPKSPRPPPSARRHRARRRDPRVPRRSAAGLFRAAAADSGGKK